METTRMLKKTTLAVLLIFTMALAACAPDYVDTETKVVAVDYKELVENNLYYIPYDHYDLDLPNKYETFLEKESDLKVISVTPDLDADMHNSVSGYFIFTELKE